MDTAQLAQALRTALLTAMEADDFDVTPGTAGDLDVSTDDWTLRIEGWPSGVAWLAIDEEPDDPAQYGTARRAVMSEAVEQALAALDIELGGELTRALASSSDPFTLDFVAALEQAKSRLHGAT